MVLLYFETLKDVMDSHRSLLNYESKKDLTETDEDMLNELEGKNSKRTYIEMTAMSL